MNQYVYFLGDKRSVKIGKTNNLAKRFGSIRTASPVELELLVSIQCVSMSKTEKHLHDFFASLRFKGEWFHRTNELANLIGNLKLIEEPTDLHLGQLLGMIAARRENKPAAYYWHRLRAMHKALLGVGFDVNGADFIARNNEFMAYLASEHPSLYRTDMIVSNGIIARYLDVPVLPYPEYELVKLIEPDERVLEINNAS